MNDRTLYEQNCYQTRNEMKASESLPLIAALAFVGVDKDLSVTRDNKISCR